MHRCADCGFLSARLREERELVEVEQQMRVRWELPLSTNRSYNLYEEIPICFARAFDLREEIGSFNTERVTERITIQRDCGSFIPWQQGLTPKEHQEMFNAQEQQRLNEERKQLDHERQDQRDDAQREWQQAQDRSRREREEARDKENRERQDARDKENRDWQARQNNINRAVQVTLALLALSGGLFGVWYGKRLSTSPPNNNEQPADTKPGPKPVDPSPPTKT